MRIGRAGSLLVRASPEARVETAKSPIEYPNLTCFSPIVCMRISFLKGAPEIVFVRTISPCQVLLKIIFMRTISPVCLTCEDR